MAPPSLVHNTRPGFHPENPSFRTRHLVVVPQQEERRPKGVATTTTGKSTGEGLRLDQCRACRTLTGNKQQHASRRLRNASAREITRHTPECHHGTTRAHQCTGSTQRKPPGPTTEAAPNP